MSERAQPVRLSPPEVVNAHGTSYIRLDIVKRVLAERDGDAPQPAHNGDSPSAAS